MYEIIIIIIHQRRIKKFNLKIYYTLKKKLLYIYIYISLFFFKKKYILYEDNTNS